MALAKPDFCGLAGAAGLFSFARINHIFYSSFTGKELAYGERA